MQVCVQTDVKCVNKPTNDYQLASIIIIQIQIKQRRKYKMHVSPVR